MIPAEQYQDIDFEFGADFTVNFIQILIADNLFSK